VTSAKGRASQPQNAAYNLTKYAAESFSEITRMEMKQLGVKVVVIEPGNYGGATGCLNKDGVGRLPVNITRVARINLVSSSFSV
jgi:3-hydroxybutyrate dehydrogenase